MAGPDAKSHLHRYLQAGRDAVLWKLDGLSEYGIRRPLSATGTNLLGLVKHLAGVEMGYFGEVFDRPFGNPPPWVDDDAEFNADMWATAEESREEIIDLYRRVWAHADATIEALPLDAGGLVPWWPDNRAGVTLHQVLVHVVAETHRHAGHADLVRELIDGGVGLQDGNDNMPPADSQWWRPTARGWKRWRGRRASGRARTGERGGSVRGDRGCPGGAAAERPGRARRAVRGVRRVGGRAGLRALPAGRSPTSMRHAR